MEGETMIANDTIITTETKANCIWADVIDNKTKCCMITAFTVNGAISAVVLSWLMYQRPFKTSLEKVKNSRSYDNLFIFITAKYLRTIVSLFSKFDSVRQIANIWFERCDILPFLETFFSVFEVEALTHVCIERYVVAKYITNGWEINVGHYRLYLFLSLFFAGLYSVPPLYGLGGYGRDFDCISCTYDMLLPDTWQRYLITTVFFLRSFKPAAFMVIMLYWARKLEFNMDKDSKKKVDFCLTEYVSIVTLLHLIAWTPIALIKARVVLSQLLYDEVYIPSRFGTLLAMTIQEIAPTIVTIVPMFIIYRHFTSIHKFCQKIMYFANVADDKELTSKKDSLFKAE